MSTTPRTDSKVFTVGCNPDEGFEAVPADHARQLETELAAANAELKACEDLRLSWSCGENLSVGEQARRMHECLNSMERQKNDAWNEVNHMKRELAAKTAECNRLRETGEMWRDRVLDVESTLIDAKMDSKRLQLIEDNGYLVRCESDDKGDPADWRVYDVDSDDDGETFKEVEIARGDDLREVIDIVMVEHSEPSEGGTES